MRYDLHIHTRYSKCATLKAEDILKIAKRKKFDGIAVTDHNSMLGGLEVSKLNKDKDFEVIVGSEIKTNWGDLLVYYQTEEIKEREFFSVLDRVREQGGFASVAHPYRIVPWNTFKGDFSQLNPHGMLRKDTSSDGGADSSVKGYNARGLRLVPCMEVFNSRSVPFENYRAKMIAKKFGLLGTGGSDAHFKFDVGNGYTEFDGDLLKAVKMKKLRTGGTIKYGIVSGCMSFLKKRIIRR